MQGRIFEFNSLGHHRPSPKNDGYDGQLKPLPFKAVQHKRQSTKRNVDSSSFEKYDMIKTRKFSQNCFTENGHQFSEFVRYESQYSFIINNN